MDITSTIAFVVWVLLIANAKRTFKILHKKVTTETFITLQVMYMVAIITTTMIWGRIR